MLPPGECKDQSDAQRKYCAYPQPPELYASPSWTELKDYQAGVEKCLERYEWVKQCKGKMSPNCTF